MSCLPPLVRPATPLARRAGIPAADSGSGDAPGRSFLGRQFISTGMIRFRAEPQAGRRGMNPQLAQFVPFVVVLGCGAVAAVSDLRTMRVRNALTIPLIVSGILFHAVTPLGKGWAFGLGGASVGFLLLFVLFILGGIGAGDVKLLTGVGAWLGPSAVFYVFMTAGLIGGFVSLLVVMKGRTFSDTWARFRVMWFQVVSLSKYVAADDSVEVACNNDQQRHRLIPFGAVIFVATIAVALVIVLAR